jgi:hypothetical protein
MSIFLLKEGGNERDVAKNKGDKQTTYNIHIFMTQKNHTLNILFTTSSLAISNNEKNIEQTQRKILILDTKSPNHNIFKCHFFFFLALFLQQERKFSISIPNTKYQNKTHGQKNFKTTSK